MKEVYESGLKRGSIKQEFVEVNKDGYSRKRDIFFVACYSDGCL